VFVRLWERRETLVVSGTLRQYVFVATRLRALELLRRDRMEGRHAGRVAEQTIDETAERGAQLEDELERLDRFIAVTRAVQELPPRQREIVRLRWVEGLTNAQAAARLGISVKGVEIQLTRALQTLRGRLRE
jgi:RNA polymerase sigma-70 factor (ECF subfamily)